MKLNENVASLTAPSRHQEEKEEPYALPLVDEDPAADNSCHSCIEELSAACVGGDEGSTHSTSSCSSRLHRNHNHSSRSSMRSIRSTRRRSLLSSPRKLLTPTSTSSSNKVLSSPQTVLASPRRKVQLMSPKQKSLAALSRSSLHILNNDDTTNHSHSQHNEQTVELVDNVANKEVAPRMLDASPQIPLRAASVHHSDGNPAPAATTKNESPRRQRRNESPSRRSKSRLPRLDVVANVKHHRTIINEASTKSNKDVHHAQIAATRLVVAVTEFDLSSTPKRFSVFCSNVCLGSLRHLPQKTDEPPQLSIELGEDDSDLLRRGKLELRVYAAGGSWIGTVSVPANRSSSPTWYSVMKGDSALPSTLARKQRLRVRVDVSPRAYRELLTGNVLPLTKSLTQLTISCSNHSSGPLETSCVAVDSSQGRVVWDECVYHANRMNASGSVSHPTAAIGVQTNNTYFSDNQLVLDLMAVPRSVAAFFILVQQRKPMTHNGEGSSDNYDSPFLLGNGLEIRLQNSSTGTGLALFRPMACPDNASMVALIRVARKSDENDCNDEPWQITAIGHAYPVVCDFGSVLPELQSMSRDLLPTPDGVPPTERTALMRRGQAVQLRDYQHKSKKLAVGLFWQVANGGNLFAAAALLDRSLEKVEMISAHKFKSKTDNWGVKHHSQNNSNSTNSRAKNFGKFHIDFDQVPERVHYICVGVGPSMSSQQQEADHISNVACHVIDPVDGIELTRCTLSRNHNNGNKVKSLLVGCFYRGETDKDWNYAVLDMGSGDSSLVARIEEFKQSRPLAPAPRVPSRMAGHVPRMVPLRDPPPMVRLCTER